MRDGTKGAFTAPLGMCTPFGGRIFVQVVLVTEPAPWVSLVEEEGEEVVEEVEEGERSSFRLEIRIWPAETVRMLEVIHSAAEDDDEDGV